MIIKLDVVLRSENIRKRLVEKIRNGKIFVYPTDTIYGLGCDATNEKAVKKLRNMKESNHPFSVIAPSKEWMYENLLVKHEDYLKKLPGPYTLVFLKKKKNFLNSVSESDSLGVRIPDHSLTEVIQQSKRPFITTSANLSGMKPITSIANIPEKIKADVIVDAGEIRGKPSKVVDLTGKTPMILRE
jgi:L-threonylcarbamoyladenylate synthase